MWRMMVAVFGLLLVGCGVSPTTTQVKDTPIEAAFKQAKNENKQVLVYVHATWCAPCTHFQKETLNDLHVKLLIFQKFILVMIDVDVDPDMALFYDAIHIPTLLVLNLDNSVKDRIVGYQKAETCLEWLKKNSPAK